MEIIPKKEKKNPFSADLIVFYIGIAALLFAVVASATLFFLKIKAAEEAKEVALMIDNRKDEETVIAQREMEKFYFQTLDFSYVLNKRKSAVNFFNILENSVHPNIYFTYIDVYPLEEYAELKGFSMDVVSLDQQIKSMEASDEIKEIKIESFSRNRDGGWDFEIKINLGDIPFNEKK